MVPIPSASGALGTKKLHERLRNIAASSEFRIPLLLSFIIGNIHGELYLSSMTVPKGETGLEEVRQLIFFN
jgi:hypothetical protein